MNKKYKIAIVPKQASKHNFASTLKRLSDIADLEVIPLSSLPPSVSKKVLVKDIDITERGFHPNNYDLTILIGSEAFKYFTKRTGVGLYAGKVVPAINYPDALFSVLPNPAVLAFQPSVKPKLERAEEEIIKLLETGENQVERGEYKTYYDDPKELRKYLRQICRDPETKVVAVDTETAGFNGFTDELLGVSISHKEKQGMYFGLMCFDELNEQLLQNLIETKEVVLHNSKFDMHFLARHLGIRWNKAKRVHDSMIQHYVLDERSPHGLKPLAMKYTSMGDYDFELDEFKKNDMKARGLQAQHYSYAYIPFEILAEYGAMDTDATLRLFNFFYPKIRNSPNLSKVYDFMLDANMTLFSIEFGGIPVSVDRLNKAIELCENKIEDSTNALYNTPEAKKFEKDNGSPLNTGSPVQLRKFLYDYLKLPVVKVYTGTGALSTNADVLSELAPKHEAVAHIQAVKKYTKLRNTYLVKIASNVDPDGNVRTGLNLTTTTSGRLSSSGNFNAQNLPRDDGLVKGCVYAPEGYTLVAMDMTTAEVYVAACLSGDKKLQNIFIRGGDFHGNMAHQVFSLKCKPEEVKELYPDLRQAAKAVTFGILYGSGPETVAAEVSKYGFSFTEADAKEAIANYFASFPDLDKWIKKCHKQIREQGYIMSPYNRKRRLHDYLSKDRSVVAGEIRSGFNAVIQSGSSDLLLEGVMELVDILDGNTELDARVCLMVHDSIVAVVKEGQEEEYIKLATACVQRDRGRGLYIPGCPMGMDVDGVGKDYSLGKIEKQYPEVAACA